MLMAVSSSLISVVGVILTLAVGVAVGVTVLGVRGQAQNSLSSQTITDLGVANKLKAEQIEGLKAQVTALTARADDLQEQLAALREVVTQAAKVDLLRSEVAEGIKAICARLDGMTR